MQAQNDGIKNEDIIYLDDFVAKCEGSGPASGHPLVYLDLSANELIVCPYCSQKFKQQEKLA